MKILFVCKSNVGRSQMAEAFFARLAPKYAVKSAGTHVLPEHEGKPISEVTEKVIQTMKEEGYEVSEKLINQVTPEMADAANKIIAITTEESLPDFMRRSSKLEVWNIPDAGGTDMEFHRKVRDEIRERVKDLVSRLNKSE